MRPAALLLLLGAALALSPGTATAERSARGVVTGKVVAPFPLGGRAGGTVHLVRLDTGAVAKAVRATRSGYRISAPAGVYLAAGYAVDLGRRAAAEGYSRAFRLAGRKRVDLRLSATRRGGRALAAAETSAASAVTVGIGTPIVLPGVGDLAPMLTTELMSARLPCSVTFVEESTRFQQARRQELALSRSGRGDPATRVQDRAIRPGLRVMGAARMGGGTLTTTLVVLHTRTGRVVASETHSGRARTYAEFEATLRALARKLAERLCGDEFPIRYRVLAASLTEQTTASKRTGTVCDPVGGFSGRVRFTATLAAPVVAGSVDKQFGILSGQVFPRAPAVWSDHVLDGCRFGEEGITPCTFHAPDTRPTPDGLWPIGFSVSGREGSSTVELTWAVQDPAVGFIDSSYEACLVLIQGGLPLEARTQTVPLSKLTGRLPVTFTFSGERRLDRDLSGHPATITHSWSYSITIQRLS